MCNENGTFVKQCLENILHCCVSLFSDLGGQAGKFLNMLAGVVPMAPGLKTLAAGLKEGDRILQTRSIVKVRWSVLQAGVMTAGIPCISFHANDDSS